MGAKRKPNLSQAVASIDPYTGMDNDKAPCSGIADVCLFTFACILYLGSLNGDFVFDDRVAVEENPDVTNPNKGGIKALFSNNYWGDTMGQPWSRHHSYRPLTVLTFRWTHTVVGLDTFYYHAGNVLIHACVVVCFRRLAYVVIPRTLPDRGTLALAAAVLFAAHPVHVEAVSGIVGRADLLAALLSCISLLIYARASGNGATRPEQWSLAGVTLSAAIGGAAMLCKETGICVVGVIAAVDIAVFCDLNPLLLPGIVMDWFGAVTSKKRAELRWVGALLGRQTLMFILTLVMMLMRLSMNGDDEVVVDWSTNPANVQQPRWARGLTKLYYNVLHARLLVWPSILSADWACLSVPVIEDLSDPRNAASAFLISLLIAVLWFGLSNSGDPLGSSLRRLAIVVVVMTVVPFLPSCGLFLTVGFVVAERLLYIPSMGICIFAPVLGMLTIRKVSGSSRPLGLFWAVVTAVTAASAAKTISRDGDWVSSKTLYKTALDVLPGNCRMHHNYATTLDDVTQFNEKEFHRQYLSSHTYTVIIFFGNFEYFTESLRLWPAYAAAYTNLGVLYSRNGQIERAVEIWKEGLDKGTKVVGGSTAATLNNIALGLRNMGRYTESMEYYERVKMYRPNDPKTMQQINYLKHLMAQSKK